MPELAIGQNAPVHRHDRGIEQASGRDHEPVRRILMKGLGQLVRGKSDTRGDRELAQPECAHCLFVP